MRLLFDLFLSSVIGITGHQLRPLLKRDFRNGWLCIASYVIGVLLAFPFVFILYTDLKDIQDNRVRLVASYFLGYFGIGAGVMAGYYADRFFEE